ncbi:MAG: ABC transporter ATP-binding protein [Thermoplasmata archaeon]|nr:ABC transporter ATP-binding protein [Thermoplasmata archaeon]
MGGPKDKPKEFVNSWKKLINYLNRYKKALLLAIILSTASTIITLIGPDKLSEMTDLIQVGLTGAPIDIEAVGRIAVFLLTIYVIGAILNFIQGYVMATVSQKTSYNLRRDISHKINRLPLGYFDRSSTGDTMSRITNDVDTIGHSMNQTISMFISSVTLLVGSAVMMAVNDVVMMVTAVLSSIIGFLLMGVIMSRSQKYFSIQQENLGNMNGHVAEIYSSHNIVKAYNGQKNAKVKFDRINNDLASSAFKSQFMGGLMMPLMGFVGNFGYVMVCIVGSILVLEGQITIGTIVAFLIYVRLFTQPLSQISQAVVGMQSVAAASERVFEFLGEKEMEDESDKVKELTDVKGHVEFRNVTFSYVPGKEIIHNFSANLKPGQKVAIVGPTGAGKTTIVNLLMRFYELDSGDILIDGVSTKDVKRENVHDQFCMVLQDSWIFEGTIRENIVYSRENVSDQEVEDACRAVGLHHFISTLEDGYDTVLADNATLSVGQKQQLTIARAIIDRSPLLILDEATSSVDTRTEKIIQDAMDSLSQGRTSFVIAHRLSTIRNSDLILVMKDGRLIEQGNHDELLAQGGFYSELYNSQFEETD